MTPEKRVERRKEYHREYRARNKERLAAQQNDWRTHNQERLKEYFLKYHAENRDKILAKQKEYRARSKEKIKEHNRKYRAEHKERIAAQQKEYRERTREERGKRDKEYRDKKKSDPNYRLRNVWHHIIRRCSDPRGRNFKNYGGRGISVCTEWRCSFDSFCSWALKNGYKIGLQIDRKDNDGNYTPDNCHFVTPRENLSNRRVKSQYGLGVSKVGSGFQAQINFNGERFHLGIFSTPEKARQAYQNKLQQLQE